MLLNLLNQDSFISVDDFHELFQYLEMERRSEQLAVCSPFFACKIRILPRYFTELHWYSVCGVDSFVILED
jgi:hypothetical protein